MNKQLNATCSVCGKKYHMCSDCSEVKSFTPWRTVACSTECYKIYLVLSNFNNGFINKAETKEQLSNCNLSNLDLFESNIKELINNILKEEKPKTATKSNANAKR